MLPSHVSGGFWLQNPPAIVQAIGISQSEDIELECFEPSTREDGFAYVLSGKEHRWKMVYLVRSGSSGMSGGWRGAAIDHVITAHLLLWCACIQHVMWSNHLLAIEAVFVQCTLIEAVLKTLASGWK